jgi:hypothetical protein
VTEILARFREIDVIWMVLPRPWMQYFFLHVTYFANIPK